MSGNRFAQEVGALTEENIGQKPAKKNEPSEDIKIMRPANMDNFRKITN